MKITAKILFIVGILSPFYTFAYEPTQTHAGLTEQVVEFYNLKATNKITGEQKELMIQGAMDEDLPSTRAINHFYDPVHGIGIASGRNAKEWVLGEVELNKYDWSDAVRLYAEGNENDAFVALGHVVHLIEDMGVPDHTRNDQHLPVWEALGGDSPYEDWAALNKNRATLRGLGKEYADLGYFTKVFNDLGAYFDFLANYSNKNFFSRDTIYRQDIYVKPQVIAYEQNYGYWIDEVSNERSPIVKRKKLDDGSIALVLRDEYDTSVLSSYFDRLALQIIPSGAGVIDLFFKEANVARAEYQEELVKKQEAEEQEKALLEERLSKKGFTGLVSYAWYGAGHLLDNYVTEPIIVPVQRFASSVGSGIGHGVTIVAEEVWNGGKVALYGVGAAEYATYQGAKNAASVSWTWSKDTYSDAKALTKDASVATKTFVQEKRQAITGAVSTSVSEMAFLKPESENRQSSQAVIAIEPTVAPAEAPRSIFAGSYSAGFGGGAPAKPAPQVAIEVKEEAVVATPAVVLETASTKATAEAVAVSPSGVTPISPSNTITASTTTTFSGTYTNNASFDSIVFELKNISTTTATSSFAHTIATTTGADLTYSKEITLSEEGDWQYHARLDDSINATSTAWSPLAFFNLTISTSTTTAVATTTATSTPVIEETATSTPVATLGYTIVAEQADHSSLDTTPSYIQGVATEQNVVLSQDVTFTGANKGDKGRVVVWYYFGYGQDCSTVNMIGLTAGPNSGASFVPVSAVPNWDGSCIFRLNGGADDSVTLPAGTYALYLNSSASHSPPYMYGKAGEKSNAVYCRGNEFYGSSCTNPSGYSPNFSENLSDFAYIITSDTYIPPPIPEGVSVVPATMSPIVAEQTDHSTPDATIIDENSGYSAIQWSVELPHPVMFTGANKGDKGRVVAWYSFSLGQDCSTVGPVSLTAGYDSGVSLYPVSKTQGLDGSCVFHLDDVNGSVTLPARAYALRVGGYNGGAPTPIGKPGGNSNAVFCAGNDVSAKSCGKIRAYSENLSDFAYVVTEDSYGTPTPAPSLPIAPPVVVPYVDTTPPVIISYTFNGISGNIEADFATTTPIVDVVLNASENVDWVSIIIEDQSNPSNDKIFHSSASCVDGTTTCAKSWNGVLSGGARAPDGVYRIKVHMKDTANNDYNDFISPYFITIKTATSTP